MYMLLGICERSPCDKHREEGYFKPRSTLGRGESLVTIVLRQAVKRLMLAKGSVYVLQYGSLLLNSSAI